MWLTGPHYSFHTEICLLVFKVLNILLNFVCFFWREVERAEGGGEGMGR